MARVVLFVVVLVGTIVAPALAKDLCIQVDTGGEAGSLIVLKRVKLGKQQFGQVNGYLARFEGAPVFAHERFFAVAGQSIVASNGNFIAGLSWYEVDHNVSGSFTVLPRIFAINVGCTAGPDEKIGELDSCRLFVADAVADGHVISCKALAPPIP